MPTAFCSSWLTFRGKGKTEGVQVDDFEIKEDLQKIQPDPIDIKGTISPEEVTNVAEVPRGTCTGTLLPETTTPGTLLPGTTTPSGNELKRLYLLMTQHIISSLSVTEMGHFTGKCTFSYFRR